MAVADTVKKLEADELWTKGRHGCWFRHVGPKVQLNYWQSSDFFSVQQLNKRGEWVTAKHGIHKHDLSTAMHHAEVLARQIEGGR